MTQTPIYEDLREAFLGRGVNVQAITRRPRWTLADAKTRLARRKGR